MINYETRIETIKSEHDSLLQYVRNSINNNKELFACEMDKIIPILKYEEESIKKYEAVIKAQELIISLTQEISETNNVEDIINIRKRINYYINKIKNELRKRNVKPETIDEYMSKANSMRKDIARYIRYLKRQKNIAEIDKFHNNFENLSEEELIILKKLIKRESNYNRRNTNQMNNPSTKNDFKKDLTVADSNDIISDTKEQLPNQIQNDNNSNAFEILNSSISDSNINEASNNEFNLEFDFTLPTSQEVADIPNDDQSIGEFQTELPTAFQEINGEYDYNQKRLIRTKKNIEYDDVSYYLNSRRIQLEDQYDIQDTYDYFNKKTGKNIIHFFKNIPIFIHNKRAIKRMKYDYIFYYSGADLESFIEYTIRRNSIKNSLKCIFSRSYLFNQDAEYLNTHEMCSKWLYDFCKEHSLDLSTAEQFSI